MTAEIDPDSHTTSTTYDLQGQVLTSTDQRGVEHTYTYNSDGQETADTVTSFGTTGLVDETASEIDTAYTDLGQVYQVTTLGAAGVLNQLQYAHDGWGD